jgi:hypothetical protein
MFRKTGYFAAAVFMSFVTVAESEPRALELSLDWNDGYELLPISYEGVAEEVFQIFEEIGVDVRWVEPGRGEGEQAATTRVRVNLMPIDSASWSLPKHTMGVVIGEEVPRAAVYIFYPSVLRTLGYELVPDRRRSPRERARLTRALGRVVAHELVHAIMPDREHDHEGLLNPKLKRQHLQQKHLRLLEETADAFVERLAAFQLSAAGNPSQAGPSW